MQAAERRPSSCRLSSAQAMGKFCVKSGDRDSVLLRRKMCARNGIWSVLEEAAPAAAAADITFVQVSGSKDQEPKLRQQVVWSHGAAGRGEMPVCPDIKRGRLELEGTLVVAHELMPGRSRRSAGDATNGGAADQNRLLGEPNGQRCPRRHEGKTWFAWPARKASGWDLVRSRLEGRQRAAGQMKTGGNSTKQTRQPNRGNGNERLRGAGSW